MQIKMMSSMEGESTHQSVSSYLIDGVLLIDTGAVCSAIEVSDQAKIASIFITGPHLDNIADLAFLADNCAGIKNNSFQVYTHQLVKNDILKHLLNNKIWPDFTKIPNEEMPVIRFNEVVSGQEIKFLDYRIFPILASEKTGEMSVLVEKNGKAVLFLQAISQTDKVLESVKGNEKLCAIFAERQCIDGTEKIPTDAKLYLAPSREMGNSKNLLNFKILGPHFATVNI